MTAAAGVELPDFVARPPWWGGDLQTLRSHLLGRTPPRLPGAPAERLLLPMDDGSGDRLAAALNRPEEDRGRPTVLLRHGVTGCEDGAYMVHAAEHFLALGHPVVRLNFRGAGPSRATCRLHHHSGRTGDLDAAIRGLGPALTARGLLAVGFSLGGNTLLKYLGERGDAAAPILAAASVSAPIDLIASARCLLRRRNALYQRTILAGLKRGTLAPPAELTDAERAAVLDARTVVEFDDRFTAPRHGFAGAEDYYTTCAAARFLPGIRTPTLLVHARDDPFVPAAAYLALDWRRLPHLTPLLPKGGGHLGFHDRAGSWHLRRIAAFFAAGRGAAAADRRTEPGRATAALEA